MTTTDEVPVAASQQMQENLAKIEALTQRLVDALAKMRPPNPAIDGPGLDLYLRNNFV